MVEIMAIVYLTKEVLALKPVKQAIAGIVSAVGVAAEAGKIAAAKAAEEKATAE